MWKRKDKPSDWRKRNTRYANTKHTDCKRLDEASEARVPRLRAARLFFRLAKPWGEADPYNALVAIGRGFWGVQVKSASSYLCYIVRIEAFEGKSMLRFCPHKTGKAKYERYREAWCVLTVPLKTRGWKDVPVVCRCRGRLPLRCARLPV